jgi:hypothetical protein
MTTTIIAAMSFTVVPLHNLRLEQGTRIPFGKFVIQDIPGWFRNSETLADLARPDRDELATTTHALVSEYEAVAMGDPDPDWMGSQPRGIQQLRFESALLANLAMWLIRPSTVTITNGFHALTRRDNRPLPLPYVINWERQGPIYCHPRDERNTITVKHLLKAAELYEKLTSVRRNNSLWESTRACWQAITTYDADRRYPPFWIALESLFGRDKRDGQLTRKLTRRIAFFLADNHKDIQDVCDKALRCYDMRCKIVHGRWDNDPHLMDVMADTEAIVRTALRDIMGNSKFATSFSSTKRDAFLSELVNKKAKRMPQVIMRKPTNP